MVICITTEAKVKGFRVATERDLQDAVVYFQCLYFFEIFVFVFRFLFFVFWMGINWEDKERGF